MGSSWRPHKAVLRAKCHAAAYLKYPDVARLMQRISASCSNWAIGTMVLHF